MTNSYVMERLKNVMLSDTNSSMDTLLRVLKSDIFCLLSEYMIPEPESLKIDFAVDSDGMISLQINVKTNRIIDAGYTLPNV